MRGSSSPDGSLTSSSHESRTAAHLRTDRRGEPVPGTQETRPRRVRVRDDRRGDLVVCSGLEPPDELCADEPVMS